MNAIVTTNRFGTSGMLVGVLATIVALTACGENQPSLGLISENAGGLDRCTLLTNDEVTQIIGAHGSGKSDIENEWGLQSCRWIASKAQKFSSYPDGWFDLIEAAVFEPDKVSWARDQARGEPISGFAPGAVYDSSYSSVWFSCGAGRFCVLKLQVAAPQDREQNAIKLAKLMASRVR